MDAYSPFRKETPARAPGLLRPRDPSSVTARRRRSRTTDGTPPPRRRARRGSPRAPRPPIPGRGGTPPRARARRTPTRTKDPRRRTNVVVVGTPRRDSPPSRGASREGRGAGERTRGGARMGTAFEARRIPRRPDRAAARTADGTRRTRRGTHPGKKKNDPPPAAAARRRTTTTPRPAKPPPPPPPRARGAAAAVPVSVRRRRPRGRGRVRQRRRPRERVVDGAAARRRGPSDGSARGDAGRSGGTTRGTPRRTRPRGAHRRSPAAREEGPGPPPRGRASRRKGDRSREGDRSRTFEPCPTRPRPDPSAPPPRVRRLFRREWRKRTRRRRGRSWTAFARAIDPPRSRGAARNRNLSQTPPRETLLVRLTRPRRSRDAAADEGLCPRPRPLRPLRPLRPRLLPPPRSCSRCSSRWRLFSAPPGTPPARSRRSRFPSRGAPARRGGRRRALPDRGQTPAGRPSRAISISVSTTPWSSIATPPNAPSSASERWIGRRPPSPAARRRGGR